MGSDEVWCDSGHWNYIDGQPACVSASGMRDRNVGKLFCNGSHWHGDFSLCEVEEILSSKHKDAIKNEELVYSTLGTDVQENEEVFIVENNECQHQKCLKSVAEQASNCFLHILLLLMLLFTNYNKNI